jgi:alginate production protein
VLFGAGLPLAASAQFQLPPSKPEPAVPAPSEPGVPIKREPEGVMVPEIGAPPRPFVRDLKYQYAYGSESDIVYRRDRDLDRRLRDNSLVLAPQVNGFVVYRPVPWLETTLEMILEREIAAQEEAFVTLPSGEIQLPQKRRLSFLVDQAFATVRNESRQTQVHAGRRNYEDERHWLYDTSMDVAAATFREGVFRAEASLGREVLADLDLAPRKRQVRDRIDTFMLYAEYRGVEDVRLAAYNITRHDRARQEGRPRLNGVRALGRPSTELSYWSELARTAGRDELGRKFSGHAFDVGFTYRFTRVAHHPNVTLGYAFATGDANPNDSRNHEFRQSGLQSNETRLGGIPKFKIYGETLDPELSNLHIFTAGFGFRPTPQSSVELVYHGYKLDKIAEVLRNSALTAEMNQVSTLLPSKDIGRALDIVIAFRNVFGLRRLGVDLRAGWFFPGKAFRRNEGDEENPLIRDAQTGFSMLAKFWW